MPPALLVVIDSSRRIDDAKIHKVSDTGTGGASAPLNQCHPPAVKKQRLPTPGMWFLLTRNQ